MINKGKKSFINVESDDLNKDWLKENQEKLVNPLNLEKIEAKNFSGIISFFFTKSELN